MAISLKPESELLIAATSVAVVLAIFSNNVPNMSDVRYDKPGNANTHKSVKMAVITSVAVVGSLALLGKSPTVYTVGGATILFEAWKYHFMNYGRNGAAENSAAGY